MTRPGPIVSALFCAALRSTLQAFARPAAFHIPSAGLSSMMSSEFFREFIPPSILEEVRLARHNILHMHGREV
jgi:hypothetical protein